MNRKKKTTSTSELLTRTTNLIIKHGDSENSESPLRHYLKAVVDVEDEAYKSPPLCDLSERQAGKSL